MNKSDVIKEIIKLSKRKDYILSTDWVSWVKYSYNKDTVDYICFEYGTYVDTGGGWLKYYTKDVAKQYQLNNIEMILFKELFSG